MNTSNIAERQILGNFIQVLPPSKEYLILSFSPGSIPVRQRWRNNCLSADFLANYLSTFFLGNSDLPEDLDKQTEVKSAVSYIANELLENSMKYSAKTSTHPISIQIHLNPDSIFFQLTNSISVERTQEFQNYIKTLLNSDPSELYITLLEQNALDEDNRESGLGLLTMLNDYGAKLGWKFEQLSQNAEMTVTTMVQLAI